MLKVTGRPRSPLLLPFVKSFHYHENDLPFGLERIVPNGQAHLMINLAEDEFRTYDRSRPARIDSHSGAVLAGPHAQSLIIDTRQQQWLTAIQFRPGGAGYFVPMPMREVSNQVVSIESLWHSEGATLRERLLEAATPQARFMVLEELLIQHLAPSLDPAVGYAMRALERGMRVSDVALRLGLLPNTFVRRFTNKVGITPKRYARVRRMQRAMRSMRAPRPTEWSWLAAQHGYADQSHLIHEFRELADITPSEYKPHSPQRSNHIPVLAQ